MDAIYMTEKKSSVYNLYLQTDDQDFVGFQPPVQPTNKTNKANVTWSMNWNEFFRDNNINGKYTRCRVRYQLISTEVVSTGLVTNNYLGYVSCNLQTNNSLATANGGTVLGLLYPQLVTTPSTNTNWYFNSTTLDERGVDVVIPTGSQSFTISLYNSANTLFTFGANGFQIMMTFELYNGK
jgi:hypothetical protein